MNQLIIVVVSGAVLIGLVVWGQENQAPTWLYLLASAPLAWVRIFGGRPKEESSVRKGLGILYLFGTSVFLMFIGLAGVATRGTWGEIMAPALPFGAAIFLLALLIIWFRPK